MIDDIHKLSHVGNIHGLSHRIHEISHIGDIHVVAKLTPKLTDVTCLVNILNKTHIVSHIEFYFKAVIFRTNIYLILIDIILFHISKQMQKRCVITCLFYQCFLPCNSFRRENISISD